MDCVNPISIPRLHGFGSSDRINVPCGKCLFCMSNKRSEWAFRLGQQLKASHTASFLTLTYSDEHLPFGETLPSLSKSDLQLFLKRFRHHDIKSYLHPIKVPEFVSKLPSIKYYACGEYGSYTNRPHYHLIIFNHDQEHLEINLVKSWLKGHFHIGEVTGASISYVSKYLITKHDYPPGVEPSFNLMSKGLGTDYLAKTAKFHSEQESFLVVTQGIRQSMPRYYRDKIFNPEQKKRHASALEKFRKEKELNIYHQNETNYSQYLADDFESIKQRLEIFKNRITKGKTL